MNEYGETIYPRLLKDGENFRLQKSCDTLARLEKEEKYYECVRKKYTRAQNVAQNICVSAASLSIILSMSGLGTSLTGFGVVVGIPLGAVGRFCGLLSVLSGTFTKKLGKNISKHEQTVSIAISKINSIKDLISEALKDEKISDKEYLLIIKEVDKFEALKMGIRQKFRTDLKKDVNMELLQKKSSRKSNNTFNSNSATRTLKLSSLISFSKEKT